MLGDRGAGRGGKVWAVTLGTLAGLAVGLAVTRRGRLGRRIEARRAIGRTESQLREALRADATIGRREIEVGTVAPGIIELTGTVRDDQEADHAVAIAQRIPGVRTVLNRLDQSMTEDHLAENRQRLRSGDPSMLETHWYGSRIGMGRRRQSRVTDPDRPSERVPILSRELGTNRVLEQASEPLAKMPTGVEGHSTAPAAPTDRGTVDDASHRRLGNSPDYTPQDSNPGARIQENIKKGTELTLEEAGLDPTLDVGRNAQDQG